MPEKVDIYLGSSLLVIGLPVIVSQYVKEKLTFQNPEYLEIIKRSRSEEEKLSKLAITEEFLRFYEEDYENSIYKIPLGFYENLVNYLKSLSIPYNIHNISEDILVSYPNKTVHLRPYQKEPVEQAIKEFRTNPSFLLVSKAGSGKAQPLDSLILTPYGFKLMKDLKIGDDISCPVTGGTNKILGIYPQGIKKVYEITFSDGTKAESCGEHLWPVRTFNDDRKRNNDKDEYRILSLNEIKQLVDSSKKNQHNRCWIPLSNPIEFIKTELPIDPYIMGILLGDGTIGRKIISLSSTEEDISKAFIKYCVSLGLIVNRYGKGEFRPTTGTKYGGKNRNILLNKCRSLGLCGKKSWEKRIPQAYLHSSKEDRLELLRGLLDTDGNADKYGFPRLISTSLGLIKDATYLVQSLGGKATIACEIEPTTRIIKNKEYKIRRIYHLRIYLPQFRVFNLSRKQKTIDEIAVKVRKVSVKKKFIRSIEYKRETECQCIMINAEHGLYITNDFNVTHNTVMALEIARRLKQRTLWLTDLTMLYNQAIDRVEEFLGIDRSAIGEIRPGIVKIGEQITVGMIPTIYSFSDEKISSISNRFGLVITDEAVSIPTKRFFGVVSKFESRYKLGLTALAHREDGLTEAIFSIIGNPKIQPVPGGIVYPKVIKRITGSKYYVRPDLLDKYKFLLDRKITSDKKRNSLIVDDIALYNEKFITVVLTRSVDHMENLRKELYSKYKIDSCMIHSKQNAKTNLSEKETFESKQKRTMFATFNMLKKGYDYIYIDRLVFAFPISSKEWVVQSVGRATRAAPGKRGAIVLDYLDDSEMLKAQAGIRERVYREEGLHVVTKTEKEYLNDDDKSWLFGEDDQQR